MENIKTEITASSDNPNLDGKKRKNLLKTIVRGAGIMFFSSIIMLLVRFIYRLLASRHLGPSEYGLLSLGVMVLNVGALLAVLGMNNGVVRYISYYQTKSDPSRVKGTIASALTISLITGFLISIMVITFSKFIAINIFHNSDFIPILYIFSLGIPFYSILKILMKAFIAFKKPEYTFFSSTLAREVTILLITSIFIITGGTLLQFSFITLFGTIFAVIIGLYIMEKKVFNVITSKINAKYEYKKLLSFSLPLFFSVIFIEIMGWGDTFILGYLIDSTAVGIYNVSLPLAASLGTFLSVFANIFFPVISELHTQKRSDEITKLFAIVTRWIFLLSLPVTMLFIIMPGSIISQLFGASYIEGGLPLLILTIGHFTLVATGPTDVVLKTLNKVKFIFAVNSSLAVLNIILNLLFIPLWGIVGAAIATAISLFIREIIFLVKVRQFIKFKIEFSYYIKYFLSALFSLAIIYFFLIKFFRPFSIFKLIIALIIYGAIYLILILFMKGISQDDIMILSALEKRSGLRFAFIKKIINRFI